MANTPNLDLENMNILADTEYVYNQLVTEIITKANNNILKIDELPNDFITILQRGVANGVATLDNVGKLTSTQLPIDSTKFQIVADITARNAISNLYEGKPVLVMDAIDDITITSGWALYLYRNSSWSKIADEESLDITWDNLVNKPTEFPPSAHTHPEMDANTTAISVLQNTVGDTILNTTAQTTTGAINELDAEKVDKVTDSRLVSETEITGFNDKYTKVEIDTSLATKVDKVTGKGLSTNDYDNVEKAQVATNKTDILSLNTTVGSVAMTTTSQTVKGAINELDADTASLGEQINNLVDNIGTIETSILVEGYFQSRSIPTTAKRGLLDVKMFGNTGVNLVKNSNLANGTTGWTASTGTSSISANNNTLINTANGSGSTPYSSNLLDKGVSISKTRAFVRCLARVTNSDCTRLFGYLGYSNSGASITISGSTYIDNPIINKWYLVNAVIEYKDTDTYWQYRANLRFISQHTYANATTANGKVMEIQEVMCIDMGSDTSNPDYNLTADQMNTKYPVWFDGLQGASNIEVLSYGKNLYHGELVVGGFNSANGNLDASATTWRSNLNYMNVKPNTTYKASWVGTLNHMYVFYYDINKKYISYLDYGYSAFTTPTNAYYIRISWSHSNQYDIQIEEGATVTTYEPYKSTSNLYKTLDGKPVTLHRVPNGIRDEIDESGRKVERCLEYELKASDISVYYATSNVDLVLILKQTNDVLYNNATRTLDNSKKVVIPNFNAISGSTTDNIIYIGSVYNDSATKYGLIVTKGSYPTLADAQTAFAGTKIVYQKATIDILDTNATPLIAEPNGAVFISSEGSPLPASEMSYMNNVGAVIDGLLEGQKEHSELLKHKANVEQEDWITATLQNGWTGSLQYRRNQIGQLEIKSNNLTPGTLTSNTIISQLATDYKPLTHTPIIAFKNTDGATLKGLMLNDEGAFKVYGSEIVNGSPYSINSVIN